MESRHCQLTYAVGRRGRCPSEACADAARTNALKVVLSAHPVRLPAGEEAVAAIA